jgi:hypothetical protein
VSIDEMVAKYIHMREKKSRLKREYDEAAATTVKRTPD